MQRLTLNQKQKLANYGIAFTLVWGVFIIFKNVAEFFGQLSNSDYVGSFTLPNLIVSIVGDLIFPAIVLVLILTFKNALNMINQSRWHHTHEQNRANAHETLDRQYGDGFRAIKKTFPKVSLDFTQFAALDDAVPATVVVDKKWQNELAIGDEIEFHSLDDFSQLRYGRVVNVRPDDDDSVTLVVELT